MTGEMVRRAFPKVRAEFPASSLTWADRGATIAVETPAALYVGQLKSIIFYASELIQLSLERDGFTARAEVKPHTIVYVIEHADTDGDTQ